MRPIDADEVRKRAVEVYQGNGVELETIMMVPLKAIDNAPTIPLPDFKEGYKQAILDGKTNYSRPQDEEFTKPIYYAEPSVASIDCETCKHKNKRSIEYPCDVCGTRAPFYYDRWEADKE